MVENNSTVVYNGSKSEVFVILFITKTVHCSMML